MVCPMCGEASDDAVVVVKCESCDGEGLGCCITDGLCVACEAFEMGDGLALIDDDGILGDDPEDEDE